MSTFQASDLLGRAVVDGSGRRVGAVQDVVVRRDGDAYTVLGLVLGRSALAGRFGYGGPLEPPTPWKRVLGWMRRHERYVDWGDVERLDGEAVVIGVEHESLPRRWHDHED
ncbi:sporulation protein YlmC with PRC-barrel domain [Nocardiopsis arvandica]|uniref:Sporulation protein YlmC with PRC-barrel domain n=1 Tax=Nocardiopsis sinuspersici TaxID=501010 RepID=A0A7Z0BHP4_9ACTN|nr:sporulation protein YlmC with PRC-barrel domain [Nocardiopsis sinuspersici]